ETVEHTQALEDLVLRRIALGGLGERTENEELDVSPGSSDEADHVLVPSLRERQLPVGLSLGKDRSRFLDETDRTVLEDLEEDGDIAKVGSAGQRLAGRGVQICDIRVPGVALDRGNDRRCRDQETETAEREISVATSAPTRFFSPVSESLGGVSLQRGEQGVDTRQSSMVAFGLAGQQVLILAGDFLGGEPGGECPGHDHEDSEGEHRESEDRDRRALRFVCLEGQCALLANQREAERDSRRLGELHGNRGGNVDAGVQHRSV
ncbi:unnamed protein product, partial [Mycena citricolor]